MNYKNVVELSIRKYVGIEDGRSTTSWILVRRAIGVKINKEVIDYKTGEKFPYLERNKAGVIAVKPSQLVTGTVYAIDTGKDVFYGQEISDYEINRYIESASTFTEDYKSISPKIKQILK